jgi:hypothetical protein
MQLAILPGFPGDDAFAFDGTGDWVDPYCHIIINLV